MKILLHYMCNSSPIAVRCGKKTLMLTEQNWSGYLTLKYLSIRI
ncbi:hypothetical protein EDE15_0819 [Edaphobacter aggregans]|uniref:Uncharacterized protein n=1 Tax=Edaphobacter aggregans TaxID=570835 RepID=A0A3R9PQ27_9BACT|nr:hypothetical protein EDE15_0819 [Edaphobacter aggregans]